MSEETEEARAFKGAAYLVGVVSFFVTLVAAACGVASYWTDSDTSLALVGTAKVLFCVVALGALTTWALWKAAQRP